jgi:hypothetical protein
MAEDKETEPTPDKLPFGRFLIVEMRKLLVPVICSAIAGGGTAFIGWTLQGRGQARADAQQAASEQVLLLDELRTFVRERAGSAPVTTEGAVRLSEEFARSRPLDEKANLPPPDVVQQLAGPRD